MIHDLIAQSGHGSWSNVLLIIFMVLFAAVVYFAWRGGRQRYDRESRLPLDEGTLTSHGNGGSSHE